MKTVIETLRACLARAPKTVTAAEKEAAFAWLADAEDLLAAKRAAEELPAPDRVFAGCHLELRNLDAAEICGRCQQPAGEHRYHKSNRHRE